MHLANLDNEVYFKKVFTDKEVFTAFVKDVTGVEIKNPKIETEKRLDRKVAAIQFRLDIFAESEDERVIIEIQKVNYDYNFDRFLHYFLAALIDLQRSSKEYAFARDVYTIVVLTAPYKVKDKTGKPVLDDEVLVSDFNPRTLDNKVKKIYPHKLIFLNPNHPKKSTPPAIRDWMQLIYESIKNPSDPSINLSNPSIKKAANLADIYNMPGTVLEEAKFSEMAKAAKAIHQKEGADQMLIKAVLGMYDNGGTLTFISKSLNISKEEAQEIISNRKNKE